MSQPTWEQAIEQGPAGYLPEPYQTHWDSISAGISHVYFASDDDYDKALGRGMTEEEFNRFSEWDWQRQKRVIAVAFFEMLRLVKNDLLRMSTLAELIRNAQAAEREAIMDEWWMCVQSDLENGVKSLNERATEKWRKEYPEMARFGDVVRGGYKE